MQIDEPFCQYRVIFVNDALESKENMLLIDTITYPDEINNKLPYKEGIYIQAASDFFHLTETQNIIHLK